MPLSGTLLADFSEFSREAKNASASLKDMGVAATGASTAISGAVEPTNRLGSSWVARIAEGQLLRDAVREVLDVMKEMALFLPELALHGAVVGDVREAFDHLAASAGHASDVLLGQLRAGTHGTVDDFELMKRANKDMAAGLELTDAQFRLLADGAFALSKATGGSVTEALDKMSDALVKGVPRGVAAVTGAINLKDAEEKYAASLGGTADQLTAEQKLLADRAAILKGVGDGLARLGEATESLDEKVMQGQVSWTNFKNELGEVIAKSPVIEAGMAGIKAALAATFGSDREQTIKTISHAVNEMAVDIVDLGIGSIEAARVVHTAFAAIETVIDGSALVVVGLVTAIGEVLLAGEKLAAKLHLVPPEEVQKIQQTQQYLRDLTTDIAHNTAEAALGVVGMSAFDKTMDTLSGGLMVTRDNMLALGDAQVVTAAKTDVAAGAVKKHNETLQDTAKMAANAEKAVLQLAELEAQTALAAVARDKARASYDEAATQDRVRLELAADQQRVKNGTMTEKEFQDAKSYLDYQRLQRHLDLLLKEEAADLTSNNVKLAVELAKADERYANGIITKTEYEAQYAEIEHRFAIQREGIQDAYAAHVQAAMQATLAANQAAQAGMVAAFNAGNAAVMAGSSEASAAISGDLNSEAKSILTLAGAWITASDAKKAFDAGNTLDLGHAARDPEINALLHQGWSLENAESIKLARQWGYAPKLYDSQGNLESSPSQGERVPGYAGGIASAPGGLSWVGEHGPELMDVPRGASITPAGSVGRTIVVNNVFNIVDTESNLARRVSDRILRTVKQAQQL